MNKTDKHQMRAGKALVVSRQAAAAMLGDVHVGTVNKWIRQGVLERVYLGRRSMVTVASIEAFVQEGRAVAAARDAKALPPPANLTKSGKPSAKTLRAVQTPELTPKLVPERA
jgi:hypothetical protein